MTNRILESLPSILPREEDSVLYRYTEAHSDELSNVESINDEIVTSSQVDNATGDDLDRIGALYGDLGQRRGRTDSQYRTFLKSVANAFNGRGSVKGVKFAIASAIPDTSPSEITLVEDFQTNTYNIEIGSTATYDEETIRVLADLSDPSTVKLNNITSGAIGIEGSSSVTSSTSGLGSGTLGGGSLN